MGNTSAPPVGVQNSGLDDLLGMGSQEPSVNQVVDQITDNTNNLNILETSEPETATEVPHQVEAYSEEGLTVFLTHSREPGTTVARFEATINSSNSHEFEDFTFQVAVPKSQQLQMLAPSGTTLSITEPITQVFRVNNPEGAQVRLRLRIVYKIDGEEVSKMGEAKGIPDSWI